MTIEILQQEMVAAMKNKDMSRKTAISGYIAAIKKAAIDKGCRDNINEEFVNAELIKIKKSVQEQVDTCPETRPDLMEKYKVELEIIKEFAPSLMDDEDMIFSIINTNYNGAKTKKDVMKWLNTNYRGRMDMKVAAMVADKFVKERTPNVD
jgi:uncharacterized protein YqeY